MTLLYIINIALYFPIFGLGAAYLTRYFKLGWLNPLTIPLFAFLPVTFVTNFSGPFFFLKDGWFNPYFQYALLVDNVHTCLATLTIIFLIRQFHKGKMLSPFARRAAGAGGSAKPTRMYRAGLLFLGLFLLSFVLLAQHSFGIWDWIKDPRTGYQLHREGAGQWYALCVSFLSVSIVLATTYARSTHLVIGLTLPYLFCAYLLGSKGALIAFALYLLVILTIRRYAYLKPVALVVGGGALVLVASSFASAMGGVGIEQISRYSDYYVNAAKYYERYLNGGISLYHGEIFFSQFWALVPRSLYPDKPYVYGIIKVIEVFYPGAAEQTNTPAFATVDYFADFGWFGVIASALFSPQNFIVAFLAAVVLPRLQAFNQRNQITHSRVLTYLYLVMIAPFFLYYFDFPLNDILLAAIIGIIELANRVRVVNVYAEAPSL